ncbi:arsenical resistance protein ArsH [Pseudoalteromonas phenolica]|uniref:arsenical resistance protein ArsH n=1 Tax=Pseudoalteromonas phenolica TaxID=161398 RepID=UPI00110BA5C5|nr:arsenical resistance protein ArsH [Pseudoalteromonas phenolica]
MHLLSNQAFDVTPKQFSISNHKPRVLVLYGSLRAQSMSRYAAEEAARILEHLGAEVKLFNPKGLPLFDNGVSVEDEKVQELRALVKWSEAQVWSSPEIHGNMSAVLKNQIDWIPLSEGAVRPTQGKALAVMQVSGGSQSFNAVNNMRVLGRWMRMLTIPNQSSVAKAWQEFNEDGTMKESAYHARIVDVMEELMKFTFLTRDNLDWLVDRYSERKESINTAINKQVSQADVLEVSTKCITKKQDAEKSTVKVVCC